MPTITLSCPYKQNELVMSPEEVLETYFYGISLTQQDGKAISTQMLKFYIQAATEEVEKSLGLKLVPQIISESLSFNIDDYRSWGYLKLSYPIRKPYALNGYLNEVVQITYPKEWLSSKTGNDGQYFKNLFLVPGSGSAASNSAVFNGITPHLGFFGNSTIPYYWRAEYCTGYEVVPKDLLNFIGKLASINLFHILGDIILGAGIASQSIGIDGLSQSISTTSSATNAGYGARVTGYLADLKQSWPKLKSYYKGFEMTSL